MISRGRLVRGPAHMLAALLEVFAPECCVFCARRRSSGADWAPGLAGPAPHLQTWHATHCCRRCLDGWRRAPLRGACGDLAVWAAQRESAALVAAIGAWKYRRTCGLVRPLAELFVPVLQAASAAAGPAALAPIPLHARRRRERGFDQTLQLTVLSAGNAAMTLATDVLARRRATRQQASQSTDGGGRRANVADAFVARPPRRGEANRVALVDDLVTTGATLAAAAGALQEAGWHVTWAATLGLAARLLLDTAGAPSVASPADPPPAGDATAGATVPEIRQEQA